jgi:hypothetical protein
VCVNQAFSPVFVVLRSQPPLMPCRRRITIRRQSGGGLCTFAIPVVGQVVIITPGSGSSRENGVWGVLRRVREGRRAVRVRGDNTGGAAPWDRGLGREPQQESLARGVKSVPHGMLSVVLGRAVCQPEKRKVDSSVLSLTTSFGPVSSCSDQRKRRQGAFVPATVE